MSAKNDLELAFLTLLTFLLAKAFSNGLRTLKMSLLFIAMLSTVRDESLAEQSSTRLFYEKLYLDHSGVLIFVAQLPFIRLQLNRFRYMLNIAPLQSTVDSFHLV